MLAAVDRLAPDETDVARVVGEEREPGPEYQLDLVPPLFGSGDRPGQPVEPVGEEVLEDLLVQRLFRLEVVEQARAADTHPGGDVVQRGALVAGVGEAGEGLVEDELAGRRLDVGVDRLLEGVVGDLGCLGGRPAHQIPNANTTPAPTAHRRPSAPRAQRSFWNRSSSASRSSEASVRFSRPASFESRSSDARE